MNSLEMVNIFLKHKHVKISDISEICRQNFDCYFWYSMEVSMNCKIKILRKSRKSRISTLEFLHPSIAYFEVGFGDYQSLKY